MAITQLPGMVSDMGFAKIAVRSTCIITRTLGDHLRSFCTVYKARDAISTIQCIIDDETVVHELAVVLHTLANGELFVEPNLRTALAHMDCLTYTYDRIKVEKRPHILTVRIAD